MEPLPDTPLVVNEPTQPEPAKFTERPEHEIERIGGGIVGFSL